MSLGRFIDCKAGLNGWAHSGRGHPLPEGLRHGEPLAILEWSGWRDVIVKADSGLWQVHHRATDCGRVFQTRSGAWIPEHDERVRRYLLRLLATIRRREPVPFELRDDAQREAILSDVAWLLERNGWEVPKWLPMV